MGTSHLRIAAAPTEVCAAAGVDWVLLDLEHGAGTEEQARDVIPAAASYAVPTVVRVESTERIRAGHMLDMGAAGVMSPRIDTADEAAACVRHLRYPPAGDRGAAKSSGGAFQNASDQILVTANSVSSPTPSATATIAY